MTYLKTDPDLIRALEQASTRELSASDLHDQRVSFVMSSFKEDSSVTRARVDEAISKQDGIKRA